MSGAPLHAALAQLIGAELIFSRGEPPESTYIFKHALLRDASYASLLRGRRQQLHHRIADALKDHFAELAETQPQLIAYHLAEAGLIEPAVDYLRKAGQRAIEHSARPGMGEYRGIAMSKAKPRRPKQQTATRSAAG
jgi:predicted ATPase